MPNYLISPRRTRVPGAVSGAAPYGIPTSAVANWLPTGGTYAGLYAWWSAPGLLGLNDGDALGTWTDFSGNARDATQATAGNKPTYKVNIRNGLPAIYFDGSARYLTFSAWSPVEFSVFVVQSVSADSMLIARSTGAAGQLRIRQSNANTISAYDGSNNRSSNTLGVTIGNWSLVEYFWSVKNGLIGFYQNGTSYTGVPTFNATTFNTIGALVAYSNYTTGYIGEILMYDGLLGTADRVAVEAILGQRWALW
jgi:hypothetical protein